MLSCKAPKPHPSPPLGEGDANGTTNYTNCTNCTRYTKCANYTKYTRYTRYTKYTKREFCIMHYNEIPAKVLSFAGISIV